MPVMLTVDNDLELFVLRFFGHVTEKQVVETVAAMGEAVDHVSSYRSLLLFEPKTDLSEMSRAALQTIRGETKAFYQRRQLGRRAGAAVLDDSEDAKLILPLWNALCRTDPEFDLHYETFNSVEDALSWLDIPKETGMTVIASTKA